jgi:hypothetical protein
VSAPEADEENDEEEVKNWADPLYNGGFLYVLAAKRSV